MQNFFTFKTKNSKNLQSKPLLLTLFAVGFDVALPHDVALLVLDGWMRRGDIEEAFVGGHKGAASAHHQPWHLPPLTCHYPSLH